jgi:hypothetical protein
MIPSLALRILEQTSACIFSFHKSEMEQQLSRITGDWQLATVFLDLARS